MKLENEWVGKKNLLNLYRSLPDWVMAEGALYWSGYHERFKTEFGDAYSEYTVAAAVFAALSPNNSERGNWQDLYSFRAGKRSGMHTYPQCIKRAEKIVKQYESSGMPISQVCRWVLGPKTFAMWNNIVNPTAKHYVTVDGHMVCAYQGKRVRLTEAGVTKKQFGVIARVISNLAEELGLLPCQLQAMLWIGWKRKYRILYVPQLSLNFEPEEPCHQ